VVLVGGRQPAALVGRVAMGYDQSKMEEYAVRHCRVRSELQMLAIHQRYMLADMHHTYVQLLRSITALLHNFLRRAQWLPPLLPELVLRLLQIWKKGEGRATSDSQRGGSGEEAREPRAQEAENLRKGIGTDRREPRES